MKIVIIGGKGNGTVIASTIEECKDFGQDIDCVGFLNDFETEVNDYPVIGKIQSNDWNKLPEDYMFIYAMNTVKLAQERHKLLNNLEIPIDRFANVFHPTSVISKEAKIGRGVVLMPFALVSPNVVLGNHIQCYAQSFVGHDTTLGEMVFVANNASIGGRILVKDGAHIGSNCTIVERLTIGEYSVIGIGAVIVRDVEPFDIVVGNPGRVIGSRRE